MTSLTTVRRLKNRLAGSFGLASIARRLTALLLVVTFLLPVTVPARSLASGQMVISPQGSMMASLINMGTSLLATVFGKAQEGEGGAMMRGWRERNRPGIAPQAPPSKEERKAKVARIEVNPQGEIALQPQQPMILSAIPLDHDGNAVQGLAAEWESSNAEVVSITKDGQAIASKLGAARLTVSAGPKKETVRVTVAGEPWDFGGKKKDSVRNVTQGARKSSDDNVATSSDISATNISKVNPSHTMSLANAQEKVEAEAPIRKDVRLAHTTKRAKPVLPAPLPPPPDYDPLPDGETGSLYAPINDVGRPVGRTEPGAATASAAIEGTETPGSSNFTFGVPILGLPGRGLDVSLGLVYNSRVWNRSTSGGATRLTYDVDSGWPAPGFRLGYGQMEDQGSAGFTLTDPDGTRHEMKKRANTVNIYDSVDGTFVTYVGGRSGGTVTYANGTRVEFSAAGIGIRSYPVKVIDPNGNYIMIHYVGGVGPKISSIQDTLNRYVNFKYENNDLIAITAPGYADGVDRTVVRFYYKPMDICTTGCFSAATYNVSPIRVISDVYFPGTQSGYHFEYTHYGMIYHYRQLRGMTVSTLEWNQMGSVTSEGQWAADTTYNYPTGLDNLSDAPTYTTRTDNWQGSAPSQAVYTFAVDAGTSTITAPDGTVSETRTNSANGWVLGTTVKKNNVVLSSTDIEWEADSNNHNPRIKQVKLTNDANQAKTIKYDYTPESPFASNYNNPRKVTEHDLTTNGSEGAEVRRTETDYVTGTAYTDRGLKHLVTEQRVVMDGQVVSRVSYAYDQDTLTDRSDITMYTNPGVNERGNVTSVTTYSDAHAQSGATTNAMEYDIAGNVVEQTVNCCRKKIFTYTKAYEYAYPVTETKGDPAQLTMSATYDFNTGLVRTTTDENNQGTTVHYYPETLRHQKTISPNGGELYHWYEDSMAFDGAGGLRSYVYTASFRDGDPTVEANHVRSWAYMDGRGAVVRTHTQVGETGTPEAFVTVDMDYDRMGRPTQSSNPYYTSQGVASAPLAGNRWTQVTEYDGLGRAKGVKLQDNTTVQTSYSGTMMTVSDQAGKSRKQRVDSLGRIVEVLEPDASSNLTQSTTYAYDGLLTTITQDEQTRVFKTDSLGQLTHQKQVEATATLNDQGVHVGASSGQWTDVFKYNSHGLLEDGYDARGTNTHFTYDALNRIQSVTYSDATPTVTYTYDEVRSGFFNHNRLTTVSTAAVGSVPQTIQAYDYDQMGQVKSHRQSVGAETYSMAYDYDRAGALKSQSYPSGKTVSYSYDRGLRLQSTQDSSQTYLSNLKYYAHGGISEETLGNSANNLLQSYTYNPRLQLESTNLSKAGTQLQRYDYQYGQVDLTTGAVDQTKNTGQMARIEGSIGGALQWQQRFEYDTIGRLKTGKEVRGDQTSEQAWRVDYSYDRYGNRYQTANQFNSNVGVSENVDIVKATNRLTSAGATPVTYDDAGNITQDRKFRSLKYEYDANGRMKSVKTLGEIEKESAVYDGLGQRVQTKSEGVIKNYVYDITGKLVAEYGGQPTTGDAGGVKYLMGDHQGSNRVVMNSTGGVIARRDYLPFGEEVTAGVGMRTTAQGYKPTLSSETEGTRQKYGMTERDKESGLDHTDWRKYDSSQGRWTTPDPLSGNAGNPQSFNRYSYVQNDPVNLVDPAGLEPCWGAQCGWGSFGGWGGSYMGGNGWGSDPRPGRAVIVGGHTYSKYYPETDTIRFWAWAPYPELESEINSYTWSGFNSHGQQEPERHMKDDCQTFADIVDELAAGAYTDDGFVRALQNRLQANSGTREYAEFRAGGFKEVFKDENNSYNQVRHFVGNFSGAFFSTRTLIIAQPAVLGLPTSAVYKPAIAAANYGEKPNTPSGRADRALNAFSVQAGVRLGLGRMNRNKIGQFIRRNVCASSR
jgi:RHS repeat-associated protein